MKYKNVLCLYPYFRETSAAMGFFPPIGLEYVATALEGHVNEITLIDLRQEREYHNIDDLRNFIKKKIDLMCVSVNWSFYFKDVCNLINNLPDDIKLIVGGQHATDHVEDLFQECPNIDIIVRGEGEETIQQIAQDVDLKDIPGISYKNNGRIIHNQNRPLPPVDNLCHPNRSLRRTPYYIKSKGVNLSKTEFDSVLTARGCPYNCKFCTFTINPLGQKRNYSARTPESVVEEIKSLDAGVIFFSDDNFFTNFKRSQRLCDLIIEQGIKKNFIAQARIEIFKSPAMLRKAEKAGLKVLLIGIESPHDRILKQLDKGFTSKDIRRAFEVLRNYAFYYHCYFIYGNIGESEEEMLYIPRFAKEIGADSISYMRLQVRKFSPLKEIVENSPGYHLSSGGFVYSDRYGLDDLRRIKKDIKRAFYTPSQLYKIVRKLCRIKFITLGGLFEFIPHLPALVYRLIERKIEKKRRKRRRSKDR
ncbi:MAG: B12-binding domain-containing radical SAM protein [Planctomycetes bacterium]|nr:B12-binding domain-containing radical SAM protein [Planctomycetota bacterium]